MHISHMNLLRLREQEQKTLAAILENLKVIKNEMIYIKMGYESLLHYCVKELGYSESAAYRRISAIKLGEKIPEVKAEIEKGTINLSTATNLNNILKHKKTTRTENLEILALVKNKSTKESDLLVRQKLKIPPKKKVLKIEMSEENYKKWLEFKAMNVSKRLSDEELLIKSINDSERLKLKKQSYLKKRIAKPQRSLNPRYISQQVRLKLFESAKYTCQFPGCESKYGLEIDHIRPVSKGGGSNVENLQVLCRNHNQFKSNN